MKRYFRLTREGRVFLISTLLVGIAAINTGNNLLYLVLGLLLSLLLLSGVLSDLTLYRLRVSLSLPSRLEAERSGYAELFITNQKRLFQSFSIVARPLAQGEPVGEGLSLQIPTDSQIGILVRMHPKSRGRLRIDELELATEHPFGLIEKRRRIRLGEETLVHPGRGAPDALNHADAEWSSTEAAHQRVGEGEEVVGLRELRSFEIADDLHFLRSASLGRWVKRERAGGASRARILVLDDREDGLPEFKERFERRIVEVADAARDAYRRGESVALITSSQRVAPIGPGETLTPLLDVLALVEPAPANTQGDTPTPPIPSEWRRG